MTYNINLKKQDVLNFASKKSETLNLPQSTKNKMLAQTKTEIYAKEEMKTSKSLTITKKERDQLIQMNVQKVLAKIPDNKKSFVKDSINQKVTKQVDLEITKKEKTVNVHSKEVSDFAKTHISISFADLYKTSMPFVFASGLIGFIFYKRRKKVAFV